METLVWSWYSTLLLLLLPAWISGCSAGSSSFTFPVVIGSFLFPLHTLFGSVAKTLIAYLKLMTLNLSSLRWFSSTADHWKNCAFFCYECSGNCIRSSWLDKSCSAFCVLMNFCQHVLWVIDKGILKSEYNCWLLLAVLSVFALWILSSVFRSINTLDCYVLLMNWPFNHYKFFLWNLLWYYYYSHSAFLLVPAWYVFFYPLAFT